MAFNHVRQHPVIARQQTIYVHQFVVVVQSRSYIWLFVTSWTAVCQVPLSFTISRSLLKFMSIESVMLFNHLILCHPPSPIAYYLSQHQGCFQWDSSLHQVAKVLELQLQHQSFQCIFRVTDWFDLPAVQGTLKSLLLHCNSKASILRGSAFFMVQLSHPYITTGETIALTIWILLAKWCLLFNMLSRFVTPFLPRRKRLLISWLQSLSAVILEPKKIKCSSIEDLINWGTFMQWNTTSVLSQFISVQWTLCSAMGCIAHQAPLCMWFSR